MTHKSICKVLVDNLLGTDNQEYVSPSSYSVYFTDLRAPYQPEILKMYQRKRIRKFHRIADGQPPLGNVVIAKVKYEIANTKLYFADFNN